MIYIHAKKLKIQSIHLKIQFIRKCTLSIQRYMTTSFVTFLHSQFVAFIHTDSHSVNEKNKLCTAGFLWLNDSNNFSCDFQ